MSAKQLIGLRFGRLLVRRRAQNDKHQNAMWHCECDCGGHAESRTGALTSGDTKSCGCLQKEISSRLMPGKTHGLSLVMRSTHKSWSMMRNRCLNPNATQYRWYGGRGITVCDRWSSFATFVADMGERPPETTLDRINSDDNYYPENCRWATAREQAKTNRGIFKRGNLVGLKTRFKPGERRCA